MNFKTERLVIKPILQSDEAAVLDLLTDETVAKTYMLPEYRSRDEAEPLFLRLLELGKDEDRFVAGVYLNGRFIGMMNDTQIEGKTVEIGYAYLPAYYNRGYATEALRGAIRYLLDRGFRKVLAGAFSGNTASLRVMEKSGMTRQDFTDTVEYRGTEHACIYYAFSE